VLRAFSRYESGVGDFTDRLIAEINDANGCTVTMTSTPRPQRFRRSRRCLRGKPSTTISRSVYADMFGPTTGDRVRLADTDLIIEVEEDFVSTARR